MDNTRLLIWATFGMLLWLTYQAWVQDHAPPASDTTTVTQSQAVGAGQGTAQDPGLPALPTETSDSAGNAAGDRSNAPALDGVDAAPDTTVASGAPSVRVLTDVLDVTISTEGGTITSATLLAYPVAKDRPDELVTLLSPDPANPGMLQSGLNAAGDAAKPDHRASYTAERLEYRLGNDNDILVPLRWSNEQGVSVEKTIRFTRGSYRIDISHRLINGTDADWRGAEYAQLIERNREAERSMFNVDSYSFDGPIIYDGEKSEKLKRDDLLSDGPYSIAARDGWVGSIEHHFLEALIPPDEQSYNYRVAVNGDRSTASLIRTPAVVVSPGQEFTFETTTFVGPKLQSQLEQIDESLKLTVDYGWLTIISQPLFWLLSKVYSFVGNWGLAIILVTILIKIAFYKLTEASSRSMAKMREIQPRMKALQERYKDDRQALTQATMDLYKREKVNPAAGCLPILIQMPFFLAFYWVLLESVEMRQAPFALWITDLSSRDPYFILPIIMGAAMLVQQRLTPMSGDPIQAKVMQIMPLIFTVFFAFFPAGLVLYWVTNTLLTIAQQSYINKKVHDEAAAAKGKKKAQKKGNKQS